MKKILMLAKSFEGYGAEMMQMRVGNYLATHGNDVVFCSFFEEQANVMIADKSKRKALLSKKSRNPLICQIQIFLICPWKLYRLHKELKFDCVITFKENPLCVALAVKFFTRFKLIHSERDNPYNRDTLSSKIKMWLYRFADIIVFQTEGARAYFGNKVRRKSVLIPNFVSIPKAHWSCTNARKTFVSVGRLDIRYKRQDILIKAFSRISEKYPDWEVVLYGDGNDRSILKKIAIDLNVYDKIQFKGKTSNVSEKIVRDGVFVLSSDTEGIPNALMEAMALGMPVITTDCEPGGAKLLVTNGMNGLMVDRGDMEKMKEALEYSINHLSEMAEMGVEARKSMARFSPLIIAEKWKTLII